MHSYLLTALSFASDLKFKQISQKYRRWPANNGRPSSNNGRAMAAGNGRAMAADKDRGQWPAGPQAMAGADGRTKPTKRRGARSGGLSDASADVGYIGS